MKKNNLPIYLFFAIISFCKGIGLEGNSKIYIFSLFLGCALIFIKMVSTPIKRKELIALLIIILIGIIDLLFGRTTTILFTAISLCCLKNIKIKDIIKIMFWTRVIAFSLMIILSFTGIIENTIMLHYREGIGFSNRYTLGYSHPNFTHSSFALIVFLGGYLYGKKIKISALFFIGLLNYALYNLTISRTGFIMVTMYIIILFMHNNFNFVKKIEIKYLKYLIYVILLISFLAAYFYNDFELIQEIDVLLTGRIKYLNVLVSNYRLPLFGSNEFNNYVLFDNGYFSLLYEGGIFATIYYLIHLKKSNKYLVKNKMYDEILLVIVLMVYCVFESYYPNILMNPALLFFKYSIFGSEKKVG